MKFGIEFEQRSNQNNSRSNLQEKEAIELLLQREFGLRMLNPRFLVETTQTCVFHSEIDNDRMRILAYPELT